MHVTVFTRYQFDFELLYFLVIIDEFLAIPTSRSVLITLIWLYICDITGHALIALDFEEILDRSRNQTFLDLDFVQLIVYYLNCLSQFIYLGL